MYDYLCESNAVTHNPVRGVKRPKAETNEGKTPALGDAQARALLVACIAKGKARTPYEFGGSKAAPGSWATPTAAHQQIE